MKTVHIDIVAEVESDATEEAIVKRIYGEDDGALIDIQDITVKTVEG